MSKADMLGNSATFDAVTQPMSSRAAAFARFSGQDNTEATEQPARPTEGMRLAVNSLAHNPYNPREELQDIEDLADSLAARGLIQPVAVVTRQAFLTAHPDHEQSIGDAAYIVVDGNRRLAAAIMAGLDDLPAHLDDSLAKDADTLLENALVAAVHNKDLEPIEQARALEKLVAKHGSQRQVAKALHKSSGWVTQRLALLKLTPELQQAVEAKTLPVEVARQVGQLPQQQQHRAAEKALASRAAAKSRRKSEPAPNEGAYAVSTPPQDGQVQRTEARPVLVVPQPDGSAGAQDTSTPKYPAGERQVPPPAAGAAAAVLDGPDTLQQEVTTATVVPWHDGIAVMDLALAELTPEQRSRLLHRYIERSGSTEGLLADLSRGLPQEGRRQLAKILGQVADRLRAGLGSQKPGG
ncbi:ParB/RepB/Spo0J family partition protein [Streptomyces vinaceus]|uniref:ParB/RepB/Spo0J family partition protein n=1 Tax=Streptomyces vinaceus TaxID=1960 RepID=UPI00381EF95E